MGARPHRTVGLKGMCIQNRNHSRRTVPSGIRPKTSLWFARRPQILLQLQLSLIMRETGSTLLVQDDNEAEQASAPAPAPKPKLEANGAFKKTNLRSEENTFKAQEQTR